MSMIKVYQIKDNGFLGEVKEIDPADGVTYGWTYTAPPGEGSYKWEDCAWVEAVEPGPDLVPGELLPLPTELPRPSLDNPNLWQTIIPEVVDLAMQDEVPPEAMFG